MAVRRMTGVLSCLWALGLLALCAQGAVAQEYPTKPIKIVVPSAAGGTTDYMARVMADFITAKTGQQVIVENRSGAGGTLGVETVVKATPDGYTLGSVNTGDVISKFLRKRLSYDPLKDLVPVAMTGRTPQVLAISAQVPAKTLQEFIAYAKANPGKISYASAGAGTLMHLGMFELLHLAGLDMVHVPYRGSTPAITDLITNRVQAIHMGLQPLVPHVKDGKLRILVVTANERWPDYLPDVPTSVEAGLPGYQMEIWWGLVAPRGTPKPVIDKLNGLMRELVASPEGKKRVIDAYLIPMSMTADEFAAALAKEAPVYERLINEMGVTLD